jgi:NTP pyrophosphatase (non-canonical NTP hydrolase)
VSELDEFQSEVGEWVSRCFPSEDPLERALVLCEEAGEVARAALKRHQDIRGTRAEWTAELLKELGDVLICVAATAYVEGVPLSEIVAKRWAEISVRDYAADPQQHGVVAP